MGTLFDYIKWRGDLTFTQAPVNDVDSLIFSLISYIDLGGIVPPEHNGAAVPIRAAANAFFARNPDPKKITMGLIVPKEIIKIFRALKDTKRFRSIEMRGYVNRVEPAKEMQFSAVTFYLDDGTIMVAYRGTDDTIIGWKEDFNMCYMPVIPAQAMAASYLDSAAEATPKLPIRVTGHSKGGNLSVYAALNCKKEVKNRLINVWSNDGPGFNKKILEDEDYLALRPIIRSLVPQNSIIGMLLEHDENYIVVKSSQKGIFQHNGTTWEVMGPSFIHLEDVTAESKRRDRLLREWVHEMTNEQREEFVNALFQVLSANGRMATLTDLVSLKVRKNNKGEPLDPHVYQTLQKMLSILVGLNTKTILSDIFPGKK